MRCPECGSELSEQVTICPSCGAPIGGGTAVRGGSERGFVSRYLEGILLLASIVFVTLFSIVVMAMKWDPPTKYVGSSLDHANAFVRLLFIPLCAVIIVSIVSAQAGRIPFIRRIPGLNAIDEAVGRATELGTSHSLFDRARGALDRHACKPWPSPAMSGVRRYNTARA